MPPLLFAILLAVLVGATVAYPVYQGLHTGGIVFYMNGLDETTYLQYDFSRAVQGPTRPGQYLVTLGHELGLSGGWIDACYDAFALVAFGLLCFAIFRRLGWPAARAAAGATGMLVLPLLANATDPLVAWLHDWTTRTGAIAWLDTPELFPPALVRTPEPQFSLVLLAAGLYAALRLRAFWPAYLVLPFMYPFVAVPAAFALLACHMHSRWKGARGAWAGPLALAFLAVGAATTAYYALLVPPSVRWLMVDTRWPLLSFTGAVALALWGLLYRWIPAPCRFAALAVALAPWVADNQQVLSGHLAQPDNYEHYFGCFAVGLVLLLGTIEHARWRTAMLTLGTLLFLRASYVTFRASQDTNAHLPLTPALVAALHDDPGNVVIDDVWLASLVGMAFPRQHPTAFAFDRTYSMRSPDTIADYRCVKWRVLRDYPGDPRFTGIFHWLDDAYAYASANVLVTHIGRKHAFHRFYDVSPQPCPSARPLRYFFVRR